MTLLNQYRVLGRSGLKVSPLCLGTMTFGTGAGWSANEATSRAMFDSYLEQGGNFIDTAVSYTNGVSETLLVTFMAGQREQLVLATKFAVNTRPGDPNAGGNGRNGQFADLDQASAIELGFPHDFLAQVHISALDGDVVSTDVLGKGQ